MIYFKDLIFYPLRRWRALLAVALIAAVLLGGLQVVSGLTANKTPVAPEILQAATQQYEAEKATYESVLEKARDNLLLNQAYVTGAPMMRLDPYCCYEARLVLHVRTDYQILPGMSYQNPDQTEAVVSAYEIVSRSNATQELLSDKLQTQSQYVSELQTVTKADKATLQISVVAPTQQEAEAVLTALAEQMQGAYDQIAQSVSAHTVTVLEQSVNTKKDATLADVQKRATARISELKVEVTTTEAALAGLQPPAEGQASAKAVVKKAVIWAVIGGVLGAFLTVAVLWVVYITSDKVYAARNLHDRTGIKVIGALGCGKNCPVDRLLCRMEGRAKDSLETTPVVKDICCRAKDAKSLLVTGSGDAAQREALVQALAAAMPGVRVEDRGSLLKNGEALEALAACDAAVLVETAGVSRYSAVEKQLGIIRDYGANLLGCVLMEN